MVSPLYDTKFYLGYFCIKNWPFGRTIYRLSELKH